LLLAALVVANKKPTALAAVGSCESVFRRDKFPRRCTRLLRGNLQASRTFWVFSCPGIGRGSRLHFL